MSKILLLNGPNLNLLGHREPAVYGTETLAAIETRIKSRAASLGHECISLQSNAEHELITAIQSAPAQGVAYILFNPGGLTHTSVALRDAMLGAALPFIEIHLSNVFAREEFRHRSYLSGIAAGCIVGLGALGYELALEAAHRRLAASSKSP
jgi:3-dehydroquinate dehydratase II